MGTTDYDAVVVGSGPNGLSAAIVLQQAGLSVLLIEAKETIGGGLRSSELTLSGFVHDVCSAIHPLAVASPFFKTLSLGKYGLQFIQPPIAAAHPLDDGEVALLHNSISDTACSLGDDETSYKKLMQYLARNWQRLVVDVLGPLGFPNRPFAMASFGLDALTSATHLAKRFHTKKARALWAGMAAHSMQPLSNIATSAIGIVLMASAHNGGWPLAKGGSKNIAAALAACFVEAGGRIETGVPVRSLNQLPSARVVLFDLAPRQLLSIAGDRFSSFYKGQLKRFKYGMGVFKIDWALDGPIPFSAPECRQAGTVHLGNTLEEIAAAEKLTAEGKHPEKPFVLLAQQSVFDESRAPDGEHTGWAYCHVPNGSVVDMTERIESQVERYAPGFRDRIIARHVMNAAQMQDYNANYVGGDINGGVIDITQLFTRPALRLSPYKTSAKGLYICSASTPPGGGVHGMCGYHAAKRALKDVFGIRLCTLR